MKAFIMQSTHEDLDLKVDDLIQAEATENKIMSII